MSENGICPLDSFASSRVPISHSYSLIPQPQKTASHNLSSGISPVPPSSGAPRVTAASSANPDVDEAPLPKTEPTPCHEARTWRLINLIHLPRHQHRTSSNRQENRPNTVEPPHRDASHPWRHPGDYSSRLPSTPGRKRSRVPYRRYQASPVPSPSCQVGPLP